MRAPGLTRLLGLWVLSLALACENGAAPSGDDARILVVGWDGATWRVVEPLVKAGRMPHLAKLMRSGSWAPLRTLTPTLSPAIWTTIATGKLPAQHGILGFGGVPGRTMTTLPSSRMRRTKAFWNVLDDHGMTSTTVGWWCTWPAEPLSTRSVIVSDRFPYTRMEATLGERDGNAGDVFPASLERTLRPLVEKPNDIPKWVTNAILHLTPAEHEQLLRMPYEMGSYLPEFKYVYQSDRSILRIALQLLRRDPPRVMSVYFAGIDTVSHLYWHFFEPDRFAVDATTPESVAKFGAVIPSYYALLDSYLGQLIAAFGQDAHVLVVSDHGFGPTGRLPWSGGHDRMTAGAVHAPPGVLVLSGPQVRQAGRLADAHVLDVAPTLLALLQLPQGVDMPGRVLRAALRSSRALAQIPSHDGVGKPWTPPVLPEQPSVDDHERIERLRALGYAK